MSEPKTEVTSINVEILGRRLSFTLEEARALQHVFRDALGDGSEDVEPVRELVPTYPYCPCPAYPSPNRPYYWEYQTTCDNSESRTTGELTLSDSM